MQSLLIRLIRLYQAGTRWAPPVCRFTPSCSEYGVQAISAHGPIRGSLLTVKRLLRCHPFHACGYDPVPEPGARPRG
ncbi:MAG TPA: membrane protein insertion efficiency factor YidD [Armatimonadota bacterium]|jgi:hypothetical protein